MKRKAIVIDIDNCVLNSQFILDEIHKLGLKGEDKWEYFYEHCNSDRVEVIEKTKKFLFLFWINDVTMIFSTARNKKCYESTVEKFHKEGIYFDKLLMRKDDDFRPAYEVKREHIEIIRRMGYDIIAFIDDDLQNCEMAKSLGILALRRV